MWVISPSSPTAIARVVERARPQVLAALPRAPARPPRGRSPHASAAARRPWPPLARSTMLTTASSVSTAFGGALSGPAPSAAGTRPAGRRRATAAPASPRPARSASVHRPGRAARRPRRPGPVPCARAPRPAAAGRRRAAARRCRAAPAPAPTSAWWPEVASTAPCLRSASRTRCGSSASVAWRSAPDRVAGAGEPGERAPVQVGDAVGAPPPQVGVELGAQQRVDAEPPPALAVAHHERRLVLQVGQHVARVGPLGQRGGQRGGDGVAHAHREQHLDHLVGQRGQDLAHEVVGDGLPVAGEIGEERGRVRRRRAARCWPGAAPRATPPSGCAAGRCCAGVTCTSARASTAAASSEVKASVGRPQLPQLAGEAQPSQAQRRVGAAGQHQPQPRRPVLQQGREARDRVGVGQLLQVVEHHHERTGHGHQRVDDGVEELRAAARHVGQAPWCATGWRQARPPPSRGRRARPPRTAGRCCRSRSSGEPGDPARLPGHPVGEQERLAVARGRRDEDDLAVADLVQVVAQALDAAGTPPKAAGLPFGHARPPGGARRWSWGP